jgi:hypothetical protein
MGVAFTKIGDDIKLFPAVRHTLLSHYIKTPCGMSRELILTRRLGWCVQCGCD